MSICPGTEIQELLTLILSLPTSTALPRLARKEVLPFVSFFLASQRLPPALLAPFIPTALGALRENLAVHDDKQRHDRNNMSEALAALAELLRSHPLPVLAAWRLWFPQTMGGLWDGPKKGLSVRNRVLATLGAVATALCQPGEGEESAQTAEREERNKEIASKMIEMFYVGIANDQPPSASRAPIARDAHEPASRLTLLAEQLVPVSSDDPRVQGDDGPWLVLVNVLALLPVLMEQRFRRLQQRGIRPWITLFNHALARPLPHVRTLSVLAWTHLVYGFLRVPPDAGPVEGRRASDPGVVAWIFREDGKPFGLLNQVFSSENKRAWVAAVGQTTPTHKMRTKALALPLVHTLVSTIFGVSVLVHNGPGSVAPDPSLPLPEPTEAQLNALTHVWTRLIATHLLTALRAAYDDVRAIAWATLAAIVRSHALEHRQARLQRLVNGVFLDGSVPLTRAPAQQAMLAAKALSSVVSTDEIPGWTAVWTVANVGKVLELVDAALKDAPALLTGTAVIETSVVPFWRNLLLAVHQERATSAGAAAVAAVTDWLALKLSTTSRGLYLLGSALLATTIEVLGDCVTSAAAGADAPALKLCHALFASEFAFPTSDARAFTVVAGTTLASVHSTELAWPVLDTAMAAFDRHVHSSKQFAELRSSLAALWTATLSTAKVEDLTEPRWQSLLRLVNIYLRSTEAVEYSAEWLTLSGALATLVFGADSDGALAKRQAIEHLLAPPSAPTADVRLMSFLHAGGDTVALTRAGRQSLLLLAQHALEMLFAAPVGEWVKVVQRLLNAAGALEVDLYVTVLSHLSQLAEPTSADLRRFTPLLCSTLGKTLERVEQDSPGQLEASLRSSQVGERVSPCGRVVAAFRDMYEQTFDRATSQLEIPEEMVDLLMVVRRCTVGLRVKELVETQTQPAPDLVPTDITEPVPGQQLRTPPTPQPTATTGGPRTSLRSRGYEADASARHRFPPVPSSSTNQDPSASLPEPSLSLALPAEIEATQVEEGQAESGPSTMLSETPKHVERERSRSSISAMATELELDEEEVELQPSAPAVDVVDEEDFMTLPVRSRKRKAPVAAVALPPPAEAQDQEPQPTSSVADPVEPVKRTKKPKRKHLAAAAAAAAASAASSQSQTQSQDPPRSPLKKHATLAYVEVPARRTAPMPSKKASAASTSTSSSSAAKEAPLPLVLPSPAQVKADRKKRAAEDDAPPPGSGKKAKANRRGRSSMVLGSHTEEQQAVPEPSAEGKVKATEHPTQPTGRSSKRKTDRHAARRTRQHEATSRSPSVIASTPSPMSSPTTIASSPASPGARAEAEDTIRRFLALSADTAAQALKAVGGSPGMQQLLRVTKMAGEWLGGSSGNSPAASPTAARSGGSSTSGSGSGQRQKGSGGAKAKGRKRGGRKA